MSQNYFFSKWNFKKFSTESIELNENEKKTSENLWDSATTVLVWKFVAENTLKRKIYFKSVTQNSPCKPWKKLIK